MAILSLTNIAASIVSILVIRRLYWEVTIGSRLRALAAKHGCLPPKRRPTKLLPFGLNDVFSDYCAYGEKRMLEHYSFGFRESNAHTLSTRTLGLQIFHTDDPENIKTVLATNFNVWSIGRGRIEKLSSILGHGIFTNEGVAWKHSREMLRPCFERSQVSDVSILEKHTDRLFKTLPVDGSLIDLQPLLFKLTLDVASEFLFGQSTNLLDQQNSNGNVDEFVEAFEYCGNPFANDNYDKHGYLGLLLPDNKERAGAKLIRDFADKLIVDRVSMRASDLPRSDDRYVFLDELLIASDNLGDIRNELLHMLLAGRDTTASLLSNIIWDLSRHPEVVSNVRREILEFVGDEEPTYAQLKDMRYLRAIVNESQRLYPILPINSREALSDTILPRGGGKDGMSPVLVPKGAYITYYMYSMHRRKDLFGADADEFNPSRWLEADFRPGWAYLPFGGGPRVCIGQNFALTEVLFILARFIQTFELEQQDFDDWTEKLGLTCTGRGGCKVSLRNRETKNSLIVG